MIAITHWDVDGIACLSILYKKFGDKFKVYFSSPRLINNTLVKVIENNDKEEELYITDIATNQEAIYLSSYFKKVYWIDHHEKNFNEITSRINVYIKNYKSTARVLSEYLNVEFKYLDIIDDIDSGEIKNDIERNFADYIVSIRYFYPKSYDLYFISIAKNILNKDIKEIIDYDIIKRFRKELNEIYKNLDKNITIINKKYKIYIIKLDKNIPSNYILEYIKEKIKDNPDFIITLYEKSKRGEIRTLNNKDVSKIAKLLNGGGHKYAAGFSFNNEKEVYEKILNNI
ncbi:putative phosphohydrolase (DHH superfamily) [Candidatus Nanobsidianus stetteri]|uniref:Putative phosphohydrolase (DHH superfamily) n=1 Tax=Nanobsidianus stetteri TaxID=1294122 RepID=R1FUJ6_NANST|nr:putative phosphohydrolase (DHH superfamily) [Candidatus Nanobsidianus stetteri]